MILKRILPLLLAAALVCAALGCRSRQEDPSVDTTDASPLESSPEETETSYPYLPPPPPPDPELIGFGIESLSFDGVPLFEGEDLTAALEAANYTLPVSMESIPLALTLCGWVGFREAVDSFGYRVNGGEAVYGLFEIPDREDVTEPGGEYARRFAITVPLFTLKVGRHTVEPIARLADGSVHALMPALTVDIQGPDTDLSLPYHSSVTHLNGKGPQGSPAYEGRGGSTERGVDVVDATLDGIAVGADCTLRLKGWLALEGGVERYVWSPDGSIWYTALSGYESGEPAEGHFASLGFANASENALMTELSLDLSPCGGRIAWITVGAVPKDHPDRVVPFLTVTGLDIPVAPVDIGYSFVSELSANPAGTDLLASDLASFFDISYGAGDTRRVDLLEGAPCYLYEGIHSLQALMDGTYAITAHVHSMGRSSFLFVRGAKAVVSVDPVNIPLYNFFETDGLGYCGGAGIYARLNEGVLQLMVKALDPAAPYRIRNCIYELPAEGRELTLADDGVTVSCYVDGVLMAQVRCEGMVEYPDHFAVVQPYIRFAETATVTLADGRVEVIENTLVAATCASQAGIAIRGGHVYFRHLEVIPLSEFLSDEP